MNNKLFVLGFILLATVTFARPSVPGVDMYMQNAYCAYNTEGNLFTELRAAIMHFNESKSGQLTALSNSLSDEYNAMHDCYHVASISVSSSTPEQTEILQCVRTHYMAFNGYMAQVKALFFTAGFFDGVSGSDLTSQMRSFNADWVQCVSESR